MLKQEELGEKSKVIGTPELTPEERIELAKGYYSEQLIEQTRKVN